MVTIALTLWLVIGLPLFTVSWEQITPLFRANRCIPLWCTHLSGVTEYSALSGVVGLLFFAAVPRLSWRRGSGRGVSGTYVCATLCLLVFLTFGITLFFVYLEMGLQTIAYVTPLRASPLIYFFFIFSS